MTPQFDDARLEPIRRKVEAGERLTFQDGLTLYRSPDLLGIGWMANQVRERLHGDKTFFNVNRHINPTDVCVASCKLCAFGKKAKDPKAYTMSLEQVYEIAGKGYAEAITEFHIVGGLHPQLGVDWFCEMLRGLKQRYPQVHLKAFTMVEIGYLAARDKLSIRETLERLKDAGDVDSMPGGGAEIFSDRVRRIICDHKLSGDQWLDAARTAHKLGIRSNCTMLYGHIENEEDRVDHLLKLRALQDETQGFQTFIPLAFHPDNTPLHHIPKTTGFEDLRHGRNLPPATGQHPAHKSLLGNADPRHSPNRSEVRSRRSGRNPGRRKNLPRRRRDHQPKSAPRRISPPDQASRPRTSRARHDVSSRGAHGKRVHCPGVASL